MARGHKPRAGSRGFWPKKRAARIYPVLRNIPTTPKAQPLAFAAYKAGMARVELTEKREESPMSGMDVVTPVTILEAPPLVVAGVTLLLRETGIWREVKRAMAPKVSKDLSRKTNLPAKHKPYLEEIEKAVSSGGKYDIRLLVHTQPRAAFGKKKPELFELPLGGKLDEKMAYAKSKLGGEIKADEVFTEGEMVDVSSVTTGKGYQGPVKRFGIKVRPRKHEKKRRHVGSLGPVTPRRVIPAKLAMPGQLGYQTRTEHNKLLLRIASGNASPKGGFVNYGEVNGPHVILKGSVPGPRKRLIMLRKALRSNTVEKVEVKEIFLESQQ